MGNLSDYAAHKLLDLTLGAAAFTSPVTGYNSLHTATLNGAGSGTEVSGNSYARKSTTLNTTNFPAAASGAIALAVRQTFAAASGSWGTVTDGGLWDASSAGNLLIYDVLATSQAIVSGDAPYLEAATGLLVSLTGDLSTYLANKWLDHLLNATAFSSPANVYLGLFVSGVEVSGNGYVRKAVVNNATNFPAAASRAKSLAVAQQFADPSGSWGTVDEVRIFDASSAGNTLFSKALTTPRAIGANNPGVFAASSLSFTVN
jgi:hypothetical protein